MLALYDKDAAKRPANLSVNADLLSKAKLLGVNLSATLESALAEEVRRRRSAEWLEKNIASLDAYNAFVGKHGVFSDGQRGF